MLLANTGVTKAGYLLKCCSESEWRSYLVLLNDHCISYCSEKQNFKYPERNILLSASTQVYKDEEETVMRIETGLDVLLFRGRDEMEIKEWQRAIMTNVNRLSDLARGQFRVKYKGITKYVFLMLHRECITLHASASELSKLLKSYELTSSSCFQVTKDKGIEFKNRANSNILKINALNDIEHNHFVFVLSSAISRLQSKSSLTLAPPLHLPIHSGSLLCLTKGMKWKRQQIVLTQEGNIYMHHQFDNPVRYTLTPNSLVINTTLKQHSFELVLFSTSLHLSASSDAEKAEWIYILQAQIPLSHYDESDQLQAAALGTDLEYSTVEFYCDTSPGLLLERRGSFYMATSVSEILSRTICTGSILSLIEDKSVITEDFDSIIKTLNEWKPPLKLTLALSPRKMGWLQLMKPPSTSWKDTMSGRKNKGNSGAIWEKVYGTLSAGVLTLHTIKRDGKSCKKVVHLLGSAIGLVDSGDVNGRRGCFKVLVNGIESIYLQADCLDSQLSWAVAISQSISLQNGGGIILDQKMRMTTHITKAETSINLDELPIQSLRNEQQWLSIDKVSSVDAEEVVEYVSDFEEGHKRHVSATDFDTLLQCVSSSTV